MKLTLGDVRPTVAKMLSMASTDARVVKYVNEAQERLMYKGKWPGTYARYAVKNSNGTITWPRQLETIEAVAVGNQPAQVRNEWFEFLESGVGLVDANGMDDLTMIDRGTSVLFSDISMAAGEGIKKVRVKYDAADNGKKILLQGHNGVGEWIRTSIGGVISDGEEITFDTTSDTLDTGTTYQVDTDNTYQLVSGVQKDVTDYNVRLLEIEDSGTITERTIAEYEPTETRPSYRRSLIAGLPDESTKTVTIVGKLRFVPARTDDDWLHISYESALKEMVMSIRKAEQNNVEESEFYEMRSVRMLEEQLMHYMGDGAIQVPKFLNPNMYGGGGVPNLQ